MTEEEGGLESYLQVLVVHWHRGTSSQIKGVTPVVYFDTVKTMSEVISASCLVSGNAAPAISFSLLAEDEVAQEMFT